ncbi:hypothetical protein LX36DRAFT_656746 [Colletotrichum falcatum]|nr:hypothetical protein LX36DRAFT_656746 [Colletotrichum falcatum]
MALHHGQPGGVMTIAGRCTLHLGRYESKQESKRVWCGAVTMVLSEVGMTKADLTGVFFASGML